MCSKLIKVDVWFCYEQKILPLLLAYMSLQVHLAGGQPQINDPGYQLLGNALLLLMISNNLCNIMVS